MATKELVLATSFGRFVAADIKGGKYAEAYRREQMATVIEQLYKGNYSPVNEAKTLTEGKAKKARAYAAGFATFGQIGVDIKKVDYAGSLAAAENKPAREKIAAQTAATLAKFFAAFDAVMAEKAEPKAEKTAAAGAAGAGAGADAAGSAAGALAAVPTMEQMVKTVAAAIKAGSVSAELMVLIAEALPENIAIVEKIAA